MEMCFCCIFPFLQTCLVVAVKPSPPGTKWTLVD